MKSLILALVAIALLAVPAQVFASGGRFSRRNVQVQRVVVRQQVVAVPFVQQVVLPQAVFAAPVVQQQVVHGCAAFFAK